MSKHTPGPWAVRTHWNNDEAYEVYPTNGGTEPSCGEWSAIVEVGDDCYEDEAKANALLIAAAPEMLEFAKWVASLKTGGLIEGRAREVIAKAGG